MAFHCDLGYDGDDRENDQLLADKLIDLFFSLFIDLLID